MKPDQHSRENEYRKLFKVNNYDTKGTPDYRFVDLRQPYFSECKEQYSTSFSAFAKDSTSK